MTATNTYCFAGLPLERWAFALRVWGAMMLALYAAFWLQLDGASSAGTCVAILALPTRGQSFGKAAYRTMATLIGFAASLAITGLFSQTRDLYILAFCGWLVVCVFVANLVDGNRAYGAVLSGYTVAIVAVQQIDEPQKVFSAGVNRGAAIAVGIAATAMISDLFASPDLYLKVLAKLVAMRRQLLALIDKSGGERSLDAATKLLTSLVALHPEIDALAAEGASGRVRAAAARSTVAALVQAVFAAGTPSPESAVIVDFDVQARREIDAMRAGRSPQGRVTLPLVRSRRMAAAKATRIGLALALSAFMLVGSSWPDTYITLSLLGIVAGLGSTTPDFHGFSLAALVAIPVAALIGGVILFVALDGADQFPLLCIAMAPPVIAAALLASSPAPKLKGVGTLVMVFIPVFVSPSNPQSYDALNFLNFSLLATLAVVLLAFWLAILPSVPAPRLRRWVLRAAERDQRTDKLPAAEAAFRSAARIAQLARIGEADDPDRQDSMDHVFRLASSGKFTRRGDADRSAA